MENKTTTHKALWIALIILLGMGAYAVFLTKRPAPTLRVDPASLSVERGPEQQFRAFYDPDGAGRKSEEDVTAKTTWSQEDSNVIWVSNTDPVKGQTMARSVGSTNVFATFNGIIARVPVEVKEAVLEVQCTSIPKIARIGEKVQWWAIFIKNGVPHYSEVWSGSDGLKGVGPFIYKTYSSTGIKKAEVSVVDTVGTKAHAVCDPLEIK
ncbi:MAG: Ig-like domain-containing protein [Candidatus Sungbacteria bacterium]|nr:Ig-like domain-containing protein [Candidatus Sungbacteria bacterium]